MREFIKPCKVCGNTISIKVHDSHVEAILTDKCIGPTRKGCAYRAVMWDQKLYKTESDELHTR